MRKCLSCGGSFPDDAAFCDDCGETSTAAPKVVASITVGQGADCDVVIDKPTISSIHARFERLETSDSYVTDLQSTNGVKVNGGRVKFSLVSAGDQVSLGSHDLDMQRVTSALAQAASGPPRVDRPRVQRSARPPTMQWLWYVAGGCVFLVVILVAVLAGSSGTGEEPGETSGKSSGTNLGPLSPPASDSPTGRSPEAEATRPSAFGVEFEPGAKKDPVQWRKPGDPQVEPTTKSQPAPAAPGGLLQRMNKSTVRVFSAGNPSCHAEDDLLCIPLSHGSGMAFLESGARTTNAYVLTNAHVVGNAVSMAVQFRGLEDVIPAIAVHVDKRVDVALLKLIVPGGVSLAAQGLFEFSELPVTDLVGQKAYLSDPARSPLKGGDKIVIIGYALDPVQVSPKEKRGAFSGWTQMNITIGEETTAPLDLVIETDAAVNGGNSGGPACSEDGKLLGLVFAKANADGIGYVIPSGLVMGAARAGLDGASVPAMKPTTTNNEAYAAMARSSAYFLHYLYYVRHHHAQVEAKQALDKAQKALLKAAELDNTYADCFLFMSWIVWQEFLSPLQAAAQAAEAGDLGEATKHIETACERGRPHGRTV